MAKYSGFWVDEDIKSKDPYDGHILLASICKHNWWTFKRIEVYRTYNDWRYLDNGKPVESDLHIALENYYNKYKMKKLLWRLREKQRETAK